MAGWYSWEAHTFLKRNRRGGWMDSWRVQGGKGGTGKTGGKGNRSGCKKKTKTNRQKNNYKNKLFFHPEWHSTNNWSKVSPCATENSDQHFRWPYLQVIDSHSLCTVLQGFFALLNLRLSWKWFYDLPDMKYDRLKSSQNTGLLLMYLHCLLCSPAKDMAGSIPCVWKPVVGSWLIYMD